MTFTGTWKSTFGELKLIQNGNRVHGLYRDIGVIEAVVEEDTSSRILGDFTNADKKGRMRFLINANSPDFTGKWQWGDRDPQLPAWDNEQTSDDWNGNRTSTDIKTEVKAESPWQGTWNSSFGTLHLHQNGARVYGLYRDLGIIEGSRVGTSNTVKGRFTNMGRQGWFSFTIANNGKSFTGEYGWGTGDDKGEKQDSWNGTLLDIPTSSQGNQSDPIVLVNIGDSYAAGVGTGQYDLDKDARRSSLSGQHRAMEEFASRVPAIIINVSFTGNKLNPHIINSAGSEGEQIREVKRQLKDYVRKGILNEERVDYLIVSAGGNDMHENGLSGLIARLIISVFNPFTNPFFNRLRNSIATNLTDFKQDLDRLHKFLRRDPVFKEAKVIYCTYPDSTRDENGKHTKAPSTLLPKRLNRKLTNLSSKDFEFAYEYMIRNINQRIRDFCQLDQNYILNDVEPVSRRHGYPASHSYFVRLRLVEGRLKGRHNG